jgi:hypothetical protein
MERLENCTADHLLQLCIHHGIGIEVDERRDGVKVFRAVSLCGRKSRWTENNLQDCIRQVVKIIIDNRIHSV